MDEKGFKGRYPGGPGRSADNPSERREPGPIRSVGDIEERALSSAHRRSLGRRSRRIRIGLLVVVVAAGLIGTWLGLGSHATSEEIAEEINRAAQPSPLTDEDMLRRELIRLQSQPTQAPTVPATNSAGSRP